jgi:hypothetical protein
MVYANVWNAVDAFGGGDADTVGDIFSTFYPSTPGATSMNTTIGTTFISWDPTTVYSDDFLSNLTQQQLAVLVFDIVGKIFQSYNLHLPSEYTSLFSELANNQVPANNETLGELITMLASRFLVSAVYYLVACVLFLVMALMNRAQY